MTGKSIDDISDYHAHVYFDGASRERAWALREVIARTFGDVVVGRFHERPVGPHTENMFQVAFAPARFPTFVPWLALNRDGLVVLVHPTTRFGGYVDHTQHGIWMGGQLPFNMAQWQGRMSADAG